MMTTATMTMTATMGIPATAIVLTMMAMMMMMMATTTMLLLMTMVITGSVDSLKALLIFHAYMQCVFGPLSTIYAYDQFKFIARGKTIYEIAKEKKILVTSSRSKNFQLVFGDYWLLNFLFPAQIIFKQKNDGLHYDGVKTE
nr:hypothetical protein BaRGS_025369 [Batillaria attramentaria]